MIRVQNRLLRAIGLHPADPKWQSARTNLESIDGVEFDAILRGWMAERTTSEVVRISMRRRSRARPS